MSEAIAGSGKLLRELLASHGVDSGHVLQEHMDAVAMELLRGTATVALHEELTRAKKAISDTWQWVADVNDGFGCDTGDLAHTLEKNGFPPSGEAS